MHLSIRCLIWCFVAFLQTCAQRQRGSQHRPFKERQK
ncbi:hypothetical protein GLYMA_18G026750v4 [Glycine max]|nr:hypothetical protein GLYMA_18G026750v4 [Glycine max]KAH1152903.1 hypothetical protein GYH30_048825 [Glycine max]